MDEGIVADEITKLFGLKKDDYILFLGRLVPEKCVLNLIQAYKRVKTDKKLVIAGGTSDSTDYVQKLKDESANNSNIIFTDFVQGKVLEELYSNAYLYVLPSNLEGMPLSLLEAMSYGNCCLTSDIPECSDVIGEFGVTFKKGDADDLTKKLQDLCDDADMVNLLSQKSADYICNRYKWDDITDQTLQLYGV